MATVSAGVSRDFIDAMKAARDEIKRTTGLEIRTFLKPISGPEVPGWTEDGWQVIATVDTEGFWRGYTMASYLRGSLIRKDPGGAALTTVKDFLHYWRAYESGRMKKSESGGDRPDEADFGEQI